MSKHTPGPWAFRERAPLREIVLKRKHWEVGQVSLPNFGCAIVFGDTEANARLIAAAPDLLEAAIDAMKGRACSAEEIAISKGAWCALRDAIAKATGET